MDHIAVAIFFSDREKHSISEGQSEDENQAIEIWFCSCVCTMHAEGEVCLWPFTGIIQFRGKKYFKSYI